MPISQKARASVGSSISHNNYGKASRTLGGLFEAPTLYPSFGTDLTADAPFPNNSYQTLSSVNLPSYTLNGMGPRYSAPRGTIHGAVVRMSFGGYLLWNNTPGGFAALLLQVTPDSSGLTYNLQLATGVLTPGAPSTYVFGGEILLFAPNEPGIAKDVSISSTIYDIQSPSTPVVPTFNLPQGAGTGNLSLDTAGLASGVDFRLQMSLFGGASIGFTKLRYFLTEIVGG